MRLTLAFLTLCRVCLSQDYLSDVQEATSYFKSIPHTNAIRAPEFDIKISYIAKFDSVTNSLLIRYISQHTVTGDFHFDQGLWEIPLNELTKESFVIEEDTDDEGKPVLKFRIIHPSNSPKLVQYWMRENVIAFVQARDDMYLGPWNGTPETLYVLNHMKMLLAKAADANPNKASELLNIKPDIYKRPTVKMKFQGQGVTTLGFSKDSDPILPDGYYMAQSIDFVPLLSGTKDEAASLRKLNRVMREYLRRNDVKVAPTTWVMLSIDEGGSTRRIQLIPRNLEEKSISISGLAGELKWIPGRYNGATVKTKYFVTTE